VRSAAVAQRLPAGSRQLAHQVFAASYLDALKTVALVPVAVVMVAALAAILLPGLARRASTRAEAGEEIAA
jgi:hypothetical protein